LSLLDRSLIADLARQDWKRTVPAPACNPPTYVADAGHELLLVLVVLGCVPPHIFGQVERRLALLVPRVHGGGIRIDEEAKRGILELARAEVQGSSSLSFVFLLLFSRLRLSLIISLSSSLSHPLSLILSLSHSSPLSLSSSLSLTHPLSLIRFPSCSSHPC